MWAERAVYNTGALATTQKVDANNTCNSMKRKNRHHHTEGGRQEHMEQHIMEILHHHTEDGCHLHESISATCGAYDSVVPRSCLDQSISASCGANRLKGIFLGLL